EHGVKVLFTAPTAFRAIKKEDPEGSYLAGHDLSRFEYLFLAGERLDPDTYHWASKLLGVPVIDHWWQTESGWPMAANCMGIEPLPVKPGSPSRPVPGCDIRILDESGEPLGLVVLKAGADREPDEVDAELVALVRDQVGAFACYRETRVVERLPKTRSGKILRSTMRSIAACREYAVPSTIDDPYVLAEI